MPVRVLAHYRPDSFFGNVCELDLVFHFYKVYAILDEIFLAGEIEETSKLTVLNRLDQREYVLVYTNVVSRMLEVERLD